MVYIIFIVFYIFLKSNFQSNLNSIPTQSDILKQTSIQSKVIYKIHINNLNNLII